MPRENMITVVPGDGITSAQFNAFINNILYILDESTAFTDNKTFKENGSNGLEITLADSNGTQKAKIGYLDPSRINDLHVKNINNDLILETPNLSSVAHRTLKIDCFQTTPDNGFCHKFFDYPTPNYKGATGYTDPARLYDYHIDNTNDIVFDTAAYSSLAFRAYKVDFFQNSADKGNFFLFLDHGTPTEKGKIGYTNESALDEMHINNQDDIVITSGGDVIFSMSSLNKVFLDDLGSTGDIRVSTPGNALVVQDDLEINGKQYPTQSTSETTVNFTTTDTYNIPRGEWTILLEVNRTNSTGQLRLSLDTEIGGSYESIEIIDFANTGIVTEVITGIKSTGSDTQLTYIQIFGATGTGKAILKQH